jgi:hypothetical protein
MPGDFMTVRIDPEPDGTLEINWYVDGIRSAGVKEKDFDSAIRIMKMFVRRDLEIAKHEEFEPQIIREAREELRKLQEEGQYGTQTR